MSESQRVLSGSLTKGSRVTQGQELIPFHQGTNIKDMTGFSDRLNPSIISGQRTAIFKNGVRMKDSFDDSITLNNTLTDMREDEDVFSQRFVFDLERLTFGQPPVIPKGEPYADLIDFNPVTFLNDEGTFMYPSMLWNLGELPDHEFDGVIEPFDIRSDILGIHDLRYEGRTVRGALVGAASERPWGSKEIKDKWFISDNQELPWLDAPLIHTATLLTPKTDVMAGAMYLTGAFSAAGYEYTAASGAALELWADLDATPEDLSGNVTLTPDSTTPTDFTFETNTIGSRSYSAWKFIDNTADVNFGTAAHWDSRIGLGAVRTTAEYPTAPGVSQFTMAVWIKQGDTSSTPFSEQVLFSMGQDNGANNLPAFKLSLRNDNTAYGDSRPTATSKRPTVMINGGAGSGTSAFGEAKDEWVTQDWDQFPLDEWHHLAATVTVIQGNQTSTPPTAGTVVEFFVDGVKKTAVQAKQQMSTLYGGDNVWKIADDPSGRFARQNLFGTAMGSQFQFKGSATQPAIWSTILSDNEIRAVYEIQRQNYVQSVIYHYPDQSRDLRRQVAIQGYQNINQIPDDPMLETDYHDRVYKRVSIHNEDDIMNALRLLNSSSCNNLTDPLEKTATKGFYFGDRAGSITFGDVFILGEYE